MNRQGLTLTEVIIAVTLTVLVIMAVSSIDIVSRNFFNATFQQGQVQQEAQIAFEHMAIHLSQAHEIYDFGVRDADPFTIGARIDSNHTPENVFDDNWIVYRFRTTTGMRGLIEYYPNADTTTLPMGPLGTLTPGVGGWGSWDTGNPNDYEEIATDIVINPAVNMFTVIGNRIDVDITAEDISTANNIRLRNSIVAGSMPAN